MAPYSAQPMRRHSLDENKAPIAPSQSNVPQRLFIWEGGCEITLYSCNSASASHLSFFFFCLDGDFSDGVLITYNLTMGSTCGSCLQALASVKSDPYRKFNEETVWDYSWVIPHGNAAMDAH